MSQARMSSIGEIARPIPNVVSSASRVSIDGISPELLVNMRIVISPMQTHPATYKNIAVQRCSIVFRICGSGALGATGDGE